MAAEIAWFNVGQHTFVSLHLCILLCMFPKQMNGRELGLLVTWYLFPSETGCDGFLKTQVKKVGYTQERASVTLCSWCLILSEYIFSDRDFSP